MIEIIIPYKTPSVNHLYTRHRYTGSQILTAEARELKKEIIALCDKTLARELQNSRLRVYVEIYENWYYKNGAIRKVDIQNREKFLIDSIFEGLELDDKCVFEITLKKVHSSTEEKSIIKINNL